jgi:hypothetical protein
MTNSKTLSFAAIRFSDIKSIVLKSRYPLTETTLSATLYLNPLQAAVKKDYLILEKIIRKIEKKLALQLIA